MMVAAAHTESKTRLGTRERERAIRAVVRAAWGVTRLMPILLHNRIIAWCGWSFIYDAAVVIDHKPWMQTWIDRNGLLLGFPNVDNLILNVTTNQQLKQLFFFKAMISGTPDAFSWMHLYTLSGFPSVGVFNGTSLTARQHSDQEVGALMHGGNVSPATKHLVNVWARHDDASNTATEPSVFVLYDMVLSYDQCVAQNTTQTMTNTLTAQRYVGSGDPGLQVMSCVNTSTVTSLSAVAYSSIIYTSIGGSSQTTPIVAGGKFNDGSATTPSVSFPAGSAFAYSAASDFQALTMPLVNGDSGAKNLVSYQMASASTGDIFNLMLTFPLAWVPVNRGGDRIYYYDLVRQIPSVPRVRDGACLCVARYAAGTTAQDFAFGGSVAWA